MPAIGGYESMFSSWIFWIIVLAIALAIGVFLTWIERQSRKKVFLGQPSEYPTELINALNEYFGTQDDMLSAYLAQILDGSKEELPRLIIGIEARDGIDRIQEECGKIVKRILSEYEYVDFIPLGDDEVSIYMKEQTEPFYTK
jgi:hypothetical protein